MRTYGAGVRVDAYGQSMGGDILLTSLVFERRLCAVALDRASPDWLRPGSRANELGGACAEGDALYARHCPCNRLDAFAAHPTAVLFLCGASDVHVPRACAEAFVAALRERGAYPAERLRLRVLPSGGWCGHIFKDQAEVTRQVLEFFDGFHFSPRKDSHSVG